MLFAPISIAAVLASWILPAHAELVLENAPVPAVPAATATTSPAPVVIIQQPVPQPIQQQVQQVAPTVTAPATVTTDSNESDAQPQGVKFSQSEALRRQRMREEIKNEDLLQTRLEELRMKSESGHKEKITTFGEAPAAQAVPSTAPPAPFVTAPASEVIVAPVNTLPPPITTVEATSVATELPKQKEKSRVYINPGAGLLKLVDTAGYDVEPRFAAGVGLGVQANDHVAIEASYTFAQHSIYIVSSNPFVRSGAFGGNPYVRPGNGTVDMALKQNLFEIGPKIFLMSRDAALRPFIGFSGVYAYSYLNYNQQTIAALNTYGWNSPYNNNGLGRDYTLGQFAGSVQAGLELDITDSLSFGATFRYYRMFSSYESYPINNAALYYGAWGQVPTYDPSLWDKSTVGGSLSAANAYSVQANLRFSF